MDRNPELYSPAQRGLTATRNLRQTFQLFDPLAIDQIVLSLALNGTDAGLVIDFYEVADVNAATWTPGSLIHTISLDGSVDLPATTQRVQLDLTGADIFTLAARSSGVEGYGIEVSNFDVVTQIGNFRHSNDGTEHYTLGRFYTESGSTSGTGRDLGIALSGVVVPEPTTLSLVGLGALGLFVFRRRG